MSKEMKDKKGKSYKGKKQNKFRNERTRGNTDSRSDYREPDKNRSSSGNTFTRTSPLNDISWYSKFPYLLDAAAKIPFPYRPGMKLNLISADVSKQFIPGVFTINWAPWIGIGNEPTSPINIASRELFNKVRSKFSGSLEADSPDFMIYFMALDSIFSYIGSMKRDFRILNAYSPDNYITPDGLLIAEGYTYASITTAREFKMQLYQYINELVRMTRKFTCPALFDLFNRHYWLNDNVYTDDGMMNSQMYMFVQSYYLKFGYSTGADVKGQLTYVPGPDKSINPVHTMYQFGLGLINALSQPDDTYIISGYLTRAFEGASSFLVEEIGYDEVLSPVFVPQVLRQIENAYTCVGGDGGDLTKITLNGIVQDPATNSITTDYAVQVLAAGTGNFINPIINSRMAQPDVEEVVECSRLQTYYDPVAGEIVAGTELVMGMFMTSPYNNASMVRVNNTMVISGDNANTSPINAAHWLANLMCYDWHPIFIVIDDGATTPTAITGVDIHNITTFSLDQAKQINRVCLYSEFNSFGIQE